MSVTRTRGRLPARVYWFRRILVLSIACGLVFGIGRVLGGVTGGSPKPAAQPASAAESATGTPTALSTADAAAAGRPTAPKQSPTPAPLAVPTGPCLDSDVRVKPAMQDGAYAGSDVRLTLELSTIESTACNWGVSADTLAVKLTSGSDRIWSTQDCRTAVPEKTLVLRNRQTTQLDLTWSGRRSDADCSRTTQWAEPGYYYVEAAAMGADPESQQFHLRPPAPVTITPTPTPSPEAKATGKAKAKAKPQGDRG